jgi:hypothetical protein
MIVPGDPFLSTHRPHFQINFPLCYIVSVNNFRTLFRVHAIQRMFERDISHKRVRYALEAGETIEDYSAEMPEPSRLILGFQGKRAFHVVTSENPEAKEITIITVYIPDPDKWNKDFKSRR